MKRVDGVALGMILIFVLWTAAWLLIGSAFNEKASVRQQCLACGYSDHIRVWPDDYCIRLESGTEVVRLVEEACQR